MANDLLARLDFALIFDAASRHSLFQLKHFILGKEVSINGRIWQCLREIKVRKDGLDAVALEIEDAQDKVELLKIDVRATDRQLKQINHPWESSEGSDDVLADQRELCAIKHRMAIRQVKAGEQALEALRQKKKDLEIEATFFVEEFEKLTAENPVKSLDDEDAQREYWTAKLFQEVHIKSLLGQPLEPELVKTVLSMPDESPVKAQMVAFLNTIRDAKLKAVSAPDNMAALTK